MSPAIRTSPRLQATLDELLHLSPEDRLELGDCLLASVADEGVSAEWAEEIDRRIDEHEAGKGQSYPVREVIAELRESLDEAD
jgi:putative addiction module component (TIGR02574 family)